jgi:hypothetical protein
MATLVIERDKPNGFSAKDEAQMQSRARRAAASWKRQLMADPAHDVDDLRQELMMWYWVYYLECGHPLYDSKIRHWARSIMRQWGYRGDDHGVLHSPRIEKEQSFSRSPLTREFDLTDEEIIDKLNFQRETGLQSSLSDQE